MSNVRISGEGVEGALTNIALFRDATFPTFLWDFLLFSGFNLE